MGDPRQVWMGSIPSYLDEAGALRELSGFNVRPYKLVLRGRGDGKDSCISSITIAVHKSKFRLRQ